jgi:hypothetical protein
MAPRISAALLAQIRGRAVVHASEPLPDFLTVEEAAKVLRIGRTVAYGLTRQWRVSAARSAPRRAVRSPNCECHAPRWRPTPADH